MPSALTYRCVSSRSMPIRAGAIYNTLAHGLIKPEAVSLAAVDGVIHSLLLFGI